MWHEKDSVSYATTLKFTKRQLDTLNSEACAFGDFNGDGKLDLACGTTWYAYPNWTKHVFRPDYREDSDNPDDFLGAMDVDGDGQVDLVVGGISYCYWLKNPGQGKEVWPNMGKIGVGSCHSGNLWDVDGDGKAREVVGAGSGEPTWWAEYVGGKWVTHIISTTPHNWGSGVGDINGDGRPDIIRPDAWYEAPADPRNGKWIEHEIAVGAIEDQPNKNVSPLHDDAPVWESNNATGTFGHTGQIYVYDVDGDGLNDIITSSSHRVGIMWYKQIRRGDTITFMPFVIDGSVSEVHTLEMVDVNKDGQMDLVAGKRWRGHPANTDPLSEDPLFVYWYEHTKTRPYWKRHTLSVGEDIGAGTKIAIGDFDKDGDIDIAVIAKRQEGRGGGPWLFENKYPQTVRELVPGPGTQFTWVKHQIDSTASGFTVNFVDLNNDGKLDILSGNAWYENPTWTKHQLQGPTGDGMSEVMDVDGDGWPDIIVGGYGSNLRWYRNPGPKGGEWPMEVIDPEGNYETGALWDVDGDGKAREIVSSSYLPGVKWWEVVNGKWVSHKVSDVACNFGAGVGDVNGDGRPDIIRPNAWFEAPADPRNGKWIKHDIALGAIDDRGPERMMGPYWMGVNSKGRHGHTAQIYVYDVNKDGKNDIIVSSAHRMGIFWYEQVTPDSFVRHTIDATFSSAHALEFRDMNGDGIPDLVTGKLVHVQPGDPQWDNPPEVVWYELHPGARVPWIKHEISYGENIGAGFRIAIGDYDGDGDMDVAVLGLTGGLWLFENTGKLKERSVHPEAHRSLRQPQRRPHR